MKKNRIVKLLTVFMLTLLVFPQVAAAKACGVKCVSGMVPLGDETDLTPVFIALLIAVFIIVLLVVISKLRKKS